MARQRRKGRGGADGEGEQPSLPKPSAPVTTGLGALLEQAGLKKLPPERARAKVPKGAGRVAEPPPATKQAAKQVAGPGGSAPTALTVPVTSAAPVLSTGDLAAWNRAYGGVQPLRAKKKRSPQATAALGVVKRAPRVAPPLDPADAAARARLGALVGGGVRFDVRWDAELVQALRAGSDPSLLARVSGTSFAPEAQIDLHRMRSGEAERAVTEWVRQEHQRGLRRLLVVCGKGLHSEGGTSVLARVAVEALTQGLAAPLVLAVASANPRLGGSGALCVLLR